MKYQGDSLVTSCLFWYLFPSYNVSVEPNLLNINSHLVTECLVSCSLGKRFKKQNKACFCPLSHKNCDCCRYMPFEPLIRGTKEQSTLFLHFLGILVIIWLGDMFRLKKLLAVGGFVFSHTWKVSLQNVTRAVNPETFPYKKHTQKLKPGLNFQALYLREPSSDLSEKLLSRFCGQAKTQAEDLMRATGEAAIKSCTSFSLCSERLHRGWMCG